MDWADKVLKFWFEECESSDWFKSDSEFDETIRERFGALHTRINVNLPVEAGTDTRVSLATLIVLDQFSRNMFRGSGKAFASDAKALAVCKQALDAELHKALSREQQHFMVLPLMHSESVEDQQRCIDTYKALGHESTIEWAEKHKVTIDKFGRFPHRNAALKRESTPEELEYLKTAARYGQ